MSKQRKTANKITSNIGDCNKNAPSSVIMSPEMMQQYETELCWCINNLHIKLNSGKLNKGQMETNAKHLRTLMNESTTMIKKRQTMRLLFGDYRAKMAEEKKLPKVPKTSAIKPAEPSKESQFFRKASSTKSQEFKFDFDIENRTTNPSRIEEQNGSNEVSEFKFIHSENNFKFKFNEIEDR